MIGFLLLLLLSWLDYVTNDLSFLIFYLVPVFLLSWFVNKQAGNIIALASTLLWAINDLIPSSYQFTSLTFFWNVSNKLAFFLFFSYLSSSLKEALEREKEIARQDPLTNLANRRAFYIIANSQIEIAQRYNKPLTLVYIDLDNFKQVNDKFGHKVGDRLLLALANSLRTNTRSSDTVARLGGDEFVILMPETTASEAKLLIERLKIEILKTMNKNAWPVTASIGVVTFLKFSESIEDMLNKTDYLMYCVKQSGKNNITYQIYA
jgi:diguanylate cyclase (GGDEF)-like protein